MTKTFLNLWRRCLWRYEVITHDDGHISRAVFARFLAFNRLTWRALTALGLNYGP